MSKKKKRILAIAIAAAVLIGAGVIVRFAAGAADQGTGRTGIAVSDEKDNKAKDTSKPKDTKSDTKTDDKGGSTATPVSGDENKGTADPDKISGETSSAGTSGEAASGSSPESPAPFSGSGAGSYVPAHTHSYGAWYVDQGSGYKTRYCSCGEAETTRATWVVDQAAWVETITQPVYVPTWWVKFTDGHIKTFYSESEWNYYLDNSDDINIASWGNGQDVPDPSGATEVLDMINHPEVGHYE
mgnify:CR=1 FL=1